MMRRITSAREFQDWQTRLKQAHDPQRKVITICGGTGCVAFGSPLVADAFREELEKRGLSDEVQVKMTGCHGFCEKGPVVVILPSKVFYPSVQVEDVAEIVEKSVVSDEIIERLLYVDPATGDRIAYDHDVPFYAKQKRVVFRLNGILDPTDLDDYVLRDGYSALLKAIFEMQPEEVVKQVSDAGLRGRGGAGFPTGLKWSLCRKYQADRTYLICNSDEGDPGAFMDRSLLEGTPHAIIEGMLIAAYGIGATDGIIYVRAEYPLAVRNTRTVLEQARQAGLLGENILGSGFSFNIEIREGAGAFICGEETALIASLEGKRGHPRPRPPFPVEKGYKGKPTVINNVETLANVPPIILNGSDWYSAMGTADSKGTKIFALAGKVNNTGLVEVPMGTTFRQIVYDIGGGVPDGKEFKAVQIGGPSGACVPAKYLDLSIDYDSLQGIGAIMGSGGLIVMDENTCMVDVAKYFMEFVQNESCGKCVPCRVGTRRMLELLEKITGGKGEMADMERLEELAFKVKRAALCGLGQTAPNPVLTTLRYFRDEYEDHIKERRCPAHVCDGLFKYRIDVEVCTGCRACVKACPADAISGEKKKPHVIDEDKCILCGACFEKCKFFAIVKT